MGRAVPGPGPAIGTWPLGFLFQRNPSLDLQPFFWHLCCAPGDKVIGDDGIYLLTSSGPGGCPAGHEASGWSPLGAELGDGEERKLFHRFPGSWCYQLICSVVLQSGCQQEQWCGCFADGFSFHPLGTLNITECFKGDLHCFRGMEGEPSTGISVVMCITASVQEVVGCSLPGNDGGLCGDVLAHSEDLCCQTLLSRGEGLCFLLRLCN